MKPNLVKHFVANALVVCCLALITDGALAQVGGGGRGGGRGGGVAGAGRAGGTGSRAGGTGYASSTSMGSASFAVDPETRTINVITDPKTAGTIQQLISVLNRPAPQVLIKVVFLEVSYGKGLDFGVEGSYKKSLGDVGRNGNSATGAVSQLFGGLAGLTGVPADNGGIYQILSSDFEATLHAIATAGKAEILSRPSILARNNQPATISLGKTIPIVTGTRFDNLGNQINTISYQPVGISLTVTPFITSVGMVEMVVTPTASDLAPQSEWVTTSSGPSGSIASPVINSRTADTVVIVPDGQTVIIGGLMQKLSQQQESKIPLLGDIPVLGFAFKRTVKQDVKSELVFFLTPHIVKHPSQLAELSNSETSKTELIPKVLTEEDVNQYLNGLPVRGAETPKPKSK